MSRLARGGRLRLVIALGVAAVLVAAVSVLVFWPRPAETASIALPPGAHVHGHDPSTTPSAPPSTTAPATPSPTTVRPSPGSAAPSPSPDEAAASETSLQDAATAPHTTQDGTRTPPGEPRAPVRPEDVIDPSRFPGGCHEAYGETGQCLPVVPPSLARHVQDMTEAGLDPDSMPHPWNCAELREFFPAGIAVRVPGVDPDGLDTDGDGTACEPGSGDEDGS